jgi:hypothetical protein
VNIFSICCILQKKKRISGTVAYNKEIISEAAENVSAARKRIFPCP